MNMKKPDDLQLIANHPVFQFGHRFFSDSFCFRIKVTLFELTVYRN
ncbi:hypothetical protein LRU_01388 [Ligilactobacillus ruminis SPM0211]|jgi:hypothetical protein|uniref:Uncharacterized protein n=1 Tax=Ligilactobacillus ruminis SPM0211 TaxID=1040964 RepID=F7R126_9LACO|nr:hypothetical protein LRU_01388 [Ligilactobacillus ruminis SPM0211]